MNIKAAKRYIDDTSICQEYKNILNMMLDCLMLPDEEVEEKKEEQKFQIGDIVEAIQDDDGKKLIGKLGIIVSFEGTSIGVEFFESIKGHNCNGCSKKTHGWYLISSNIKLIHRPSLKILPKD